MGSKKNQPLGKTTDFIDVFSSSATMLYTDSETGITVFSSDKTLISVITYKKFMLYCTR